MTTAPVVSECVACLALFTPPVNRPEWTKCMACTLCSKAALDNVQRQAAQQRARNARRGHR